MNCLNLIQIRHTTSGSVVTVWRSCALSKSHRVSTCAYAHCSGARLIASHRCKCSVLPKEMLKSCTLLQLVRTHIATEPLTTRQITVQGDGTTVGTANGGAEIRFVTVNPISMKVVGSNESATLLAQPYDVRVCAGYMHFIQGVRCTFCYNIFLCYWFCS